MSYINPVNSFSQRNTYKTNEKQARPKQTENVQRKEKLSKSGKILIGVLATVAFVGFMTNRFPQRKAQKQIYENVFSNLDEITPDKRRNWTKIIPALSDREEIIITEAAKGNKTAQKLMKSIVPTEKKNPKGIKKYIQARQKYENLQSYIRDGIFDNLKRKRDASIEDKKMWLYRQASRLQQNADKLYQEFIAHLN